MSEHKVLLKWESNWADEMDISGFVITSEDIWENYKKKVESIEDEFAIIIGTNEEIPYDNGEHLLEEISVIKLTNEEYDIIGKTIGFQFGETQFFKLEIEKEDDEYESEYENEDEI